MKEREMTIVVILASLIIMVGVIYSFYISKESLGFKESDQILDNPARGFYVQIDSSEEERFEELKNEDIRIALLAYDLHDYLNTPIGEEKINELEKALEVAEEYGIHVLFRAAYRFSSKYKDPESISTILYHIDQITPVLNKHKNIILGVQAGFLGPWGEWHSSKFLTGDQEEIYVRNKILERLLANLDSEIVINVRRPQFIRDAIDAGLAISRLGVHNDALFSTKDDMGTYSNPLYTRKQELDWSSKTITTGINGGEMPRVSEYSAIENAVEEMKKLKITYLNGRYNKEVLDEWKNTEYEGEAGIQYVSKYLGYRFSLKEVKISKYIRNNRKFTIEAVIRNLGFAPISEGYQLYVVLEQGDALIYEPVGKNKISYLEGGQEGKFSMNIKIPNDFIREEEVVRVGFYINRGPISRKSDNYKSIEFANLNNNYDKGINFLIQYDLQKKKYELSL